MDEESKDNKVKGTFQSSMLMLVVLVAVGVVLIVITMNRNKGNTDTTVESSIEAATVEETTVAQFELASIDDYKEDVNRIMIVMNSEYTGQYEWSAFMKRNQIDSIQFALEEAFPHNTVSLDITASMEDAIKKLSNTLFDEAVIYAGVHASMPVGDLDEEIDLSSLPSSKEYAAPLSYPEHLYGCVVDDNYNMKTELDRAQLIGFIQGDYPMLTLTDDNKWMLNKEYMDVSQKSIDVYGIEINIGTPAEQMRHNELYKFEVAELRVAENVFKLTIYRGSHKYDIIVSKLSEDEYRFDNIDVVIEALTTKP